MSDNQWFAAVYLDMTEEDKRRYDKLTKITGGSMEVGEIVYIRGDGWLTSVAVIDSVKGDIGYYSRYSHSHKFVDRFDDVSYHNRKVRNIAQIQKTKIGPKVGIIWHLSLDEWNL